MFAGRGSYEAFRENVKNRITEAFYNLNWAFDQDPRNIDFDEYSMYKEFYTKLARLEKYKPLRNFLVDSYNELESKIEHSPK